MMSISIPRSDKQNLRLFLLTFFFKISCNVFGCPAAAAATAVVATTAVELKTQRIS